MLRRWRSALTKRCRCSLGGPREDLWVTTPGRDALWAMERPSPFDSPAEFQLPLPIIGVQRAMVQGGADDDGRSCARACFQLEARETRRSEKGAPRGWEGVRAEWQK